MAQFCIKCFIYPPNSDPQYAFPAYINVGASKTVDPPKIQSKTNPTNESILFCVPKSSNSNDQFVIPYFCVPGFRREKDIDGKDCCIFCFLFNEDTMTLHIKKRPRLFQLIVQTCVEALNTEFGVIVDSSKQHPISLPKEFIWYTSREEILEILERIKKMKQEEESEFPIPKLEAVMKKSKKIKPTPFTAPPSWNKELKSFFGTNPKTDTLNVPWWWSHDPPSYILEEKFLPIRSSMVDSYILDPLSSRSVATVLNPISSSPHRSKQSNVGSNSTPHHHHGSSDEENKTNSHLFINTDGNISKQLSPGSFLVTKPDSKSSELMTEKSSQDLFCHFGSVPISAINSSSSSWRLDKTKAHWPDKMILQVFLPELSQLSLQDPDGSFDPQRWIKQNIKVCLVAGRHFWLTTKRPVDSDSDGATKANFTGYQPLSITLPYPVPYDPFSRWREHDHEGGDPKISAHGQVDSPSSHSISTAEDVIHALPLDTEATVTFEFDPNAVPIVHPADGTSFSFRWNDMKNTLTFEFFVDKFKHQHCTHSH